MQLRSSEDYPTTPDRFGWGLAGAHSVLESLLQPASSGIPLAAPDR